MMNSKISKLLLLQLAMILMNKPYQWLAWLGTAILLLAATLAAFNVYPYYVWCFIIANTMWMIIGILWRENSLVVMNAGLTVIYLIGLVFG